MDTPPSCERCDRDDLVFLRMVQGLVTLIVLWAGLTTLAVVPSWIPWCLSQVAAMPVMLLNLLTPIRKE